jgi:hypothetical protein
MGKLSLYCVGGGLNPIVQTDGSTAPTRAWIDEGTRGVSARTIPAGSAASLMSLTKSMPGMVTIQLSQSPNRLATFTLTTMPTGADKPCEYAIHGTYTG